MQHKCDDVALKRSNYFNFYFAFNYSFATFKNFLDYFKFMGFCIY